MYGALQSHNNTGKLGAERIQENKSPPVKGEFSLSIVVQSEATSLGLRGKAKLYAKLSTLGTDSFRHRQLQVSIVCFFELVLQQHLCVFSQSFSSK